jgi:hypothetical protein
MSSIPKPLAYFPRAEGRILQLVPAHAGIIEILTGSAES